MEFALADVDRSDGCLCHVDCVTPPLESNGMQLHRRRYLALVIGALVIGTPPMVATAAQPTGTTRASAAGDPLYRYQWHLSNQGQPVIGDSRPVAGVDMDVDLSLIHI